MTLIAKLNSHKISQQENLILQHTYITPLAGWEGITKIVPVAGDTLLEFRG